MVTVLKMILSFANKGLELYFRTGNKKGIIAAHTDKVARVLDRLDASFSSEDMNLPGYKLHKLIGKRKGQWAVSISGNWRITFRFEGENVVNVDYLDYH